jgi:hypothetical protein
LGFVLDLDAIVVHLQHIPAATKFGQSFSFPEPTLCQEVYSVIETIGGSRAMTDMNNTNGINTGSTTSANLSEDTAGTLIGASKVDGTAVYNRRGDHLGHVSDLMIDKKSGRVSYAVMSFGGFLGIGESFHPLPWSILHYDESMGGYIVDIDTEKLREAPNYELTDTPDWRRGYGQKVDDYYNVPPSVY